MFHEIVDVAPLKGRVVLGYTEDIEELLKELEGKPKINILGHTLKLRGMRYQTLIRDRVTCMNCGKKATIAYLWFDPRGRYLLNFFATREECQADMLTKDHIIPKSKGGPTELNNLRCLCFDCNSKKGNSL